MGSADEEEKLESFGPEIGPVDGSTTRLREWIFVSGNRVTLAVMIAIAAGTLYYMLGVMGIIAFVNDDSVTRLAGGLTAGLFSLITIVVTINQLILSQEFTGAGDAHERLNGVLTFRRQIAEKADVPAAPASPTKFLELLAETMYYRAETLADSVADQDNENARQLIIQYANRVHDSTNRMFETFENADFGSFEAVSAAIRYDNAWQMYVAEHLLTEYTESLSPETITILEELQEELELFDVAVEHFKTTYLQRELTQFSRQTMFAGVPAILSSIGLAFLYADWTGAAIEAEYLSVVTPLLITVMILPLGLLVSYVLRIATVTRRTASIGPMVPQKDPSVGPFTVTAEERNEGEQ